jgi:hypothetical protein
VAGNVEETAAAAGAAGVDETSILDLKPFFFCTAAQQKIWQSSCVHSKSAADLAFLLSWWKHGKGTDRAPKSHYGYLSQVGVRERTGRNDGVEVEAYLRSVGLGKGYPWCAAFTNWCLLQAGGTPPKSGYVPVWFPKDKIVYRQGKEVSRMPCGEIPSASTSATWPACPHWLCAHPGGKEIRHHHRGQYRPGRWRDGDGVYRKYRLKSKYILFQIG